MITPKSVTVVQSLPLGERATGAILTDKLNAECDGVCNLRQVDTVSDFLRALREIRKSSEGELKSAALHFEIHGHAEGFQLANGSIVRWTDVEEEIREINIALRNNLLVTMAVCHGLWMMEIISGTNRSPFNALVGCEHPIYEGGIESGFPTFFSDILGGKAVCDALIGLNDAQKFDGDTFRCVTSQEMFKMAYAKYFKNLCTQEFRLERANYVFDQVKDSTGLSERERTAVVAAVIKNQCDGDEGNFRRYRSQFFMYDLFAENKELFPLSYSEVRPT